MLLLAKDAGIFTPLVFAVYTVVFTIVLIYLLLLAGRLVRAVEKIADKIEKSHSQSEQT